MTKSIHWHWLKIHCEILIFKIQKNSLLASAHKHFKSIWISFDSFKFFEYAKIELRGEKKNGKSSVI